MSGFVGAGNHHFTKPGARAFLHKGRVNGVVDFTPQVFVYCESAAEAREVAQAFTELAGLIEAKERDADPCPAHDLNMPHDTRFDDWRSCPPNCRYLRWSIGHGLTTAAADEAKGGA